MSKDWERYRNMLNEKVNDAKANVEFYEKKLKEAKIVQEVALRGQAAFELALEEQLAKLESTQTREDSYEKGTYISK
jgi:hypothetical protein